MADSAQRADWMHTASLLAQLHNTSGFAKKAKDPQDYPYPGDANKSNRPNKKRPLREQIAGLKAGWFQTQRGG